MKFSVITINYNNADGLRKTIKSVINQTCHDFEYIVIDGGSIDGSKAIIEEHERYISYWVSEKDAGIYNAMNKGVAVAHGEYCIFMNSGDCFYSRTVLSDILNTDEDKDIITGITIGKDEKDVWFDISEPISLLTFYRGTISHQASFIRTTLLKKNPYSEDLHIVADWEFWIKTLILNNCSHIFCDIIIVQIEPNGISVINAEEREHERKLVLSRLIPSRILFNYTNLRYADDQMIYYISKISKTNRIKKYTKVLLRIIYNIIKK